MMLLAMMTIMETDGFWDDGNANPRHAVVTGPTRGDFKSIGDECWSPQCALIAHGVRRRYGRCHNGLDGWDVA